MNQKISLQVLICTFGPDGIKRVARSKHPQTPGVEYIVAWQLPEGNPEIPQELRRDDFKISITDSKGLSRNRNFALSLATAPLCLISDDDVDYEQSQLSSLIDIFRENPDTQLITFRYATVPQYAKKYPDFSFPLENAPKGYFATSFEIAFRREAIEGIRFNENFGIGAPVFCCGEEDLFLQDALRRGVKSRFVPATLCTHLGSTTSDRVWNSPNYLMTKGAVIYHASPKTWFLRLISNAIRSHLSGKTKFSRFIRHTLEGVRYARKNNVFRQP